MAPAAGGDPVRRRGAAPRLPGRGAGHGPGTIDGQRLAVDYDTLLLAERDGRTAWPERLVDGIDVAPVLRPGPAARIFVSYSHLDESHRERLDAQLKVLQRSGLVRSWHDHRLDPGDDWRGTIDGELDRADLVVCLLTPDFLASDYCVDVEMERAIGHLAETLTGPRLTSEGAARRG